MLDGKKVAVVMPAYNAARTLERTLGEINRNVVDEIIVVDDASGDDTVAVARRLGLSRSRARSQSPHTLLFDARGRQLNPSPVAAPLVEDASQGSPLPLCEHTS